MPPAPDRKSAPAASARPVPFSVVAVVLIATAAALAWGNSLSAPFEMDDQPSLLENASIRRLVPATWLNPPAAGGETVGGRPILNFTFALNHAFGGLEVRGYRLVNVFIHALAALTLFGLVRRTVGRDRLIPPNAPERRQTAIPPDSKGTGFFALVVALLWLLHPLQTESVTYVVQRAESLMAFFYLFTLYAFVRGVDCGDALRAPENKATAVIDRRYNSGWLALSVGSCLLGMGTKEVMASAPLLVLLYDRAFVAGSFAAAWRARRGYYVALASTWLVLLALVIANVERGGSAGFGTEIGAWAYALTQCKAVLLYLKLVFWPAGQVFDYGTPTIATLADVGWQAGVVLVLLAASGWALVRKPVAGMLGAGFFLVLAPSSSFVPVATQTIAEHRMYLPLVAVIVLVCATVRSLISRWSPWATGLLAAGTVLALGTATFARNQVYRSELALWQDTVAKRPDNPRAHHNLGMALAKNGQRDEAMAEFQRAIALQPNHAFARFQLGTIHLTRRQWAEAAAELQVAVAADPHYTAARINLGQALTQLGRAEEAVAQYRAALTDEPGAQDARTNLAALLVAQGRMAEGEAMLREALAAAPELAEAHYHLGLVLEKTAGAAAAEAGLREAIRLKPELAVAHLALGNILAARGDVRGAEASCREAMRLDPASAEARYVWGNLLARQKRFDEALAAYHEALRLDPSHVPARNNLANSQLVTGRLDEAIANYEAVLRARPTDTAVRRNLELARELKRTR